MVSMIVQFGETAFFLNGSVARCNFTGCVTDFRKNSKVQVTALS